MKSNIVTRNFGRNQNPIFIIINKFPNNREKDTCTRNDSDSINEDSEGD